MVGLNNYREGEGEIREEAVEKEREKRGQRGKEGGGEDGGERELRGIGRER